MTSSRPDSEWFYILALQIYNWENAMWILTYRVHGSLIVIVLFYPSEIRMMIIIIIAFSLFFLFLISFLGLRKALFAGRMLLFYLMTNLLWTLPTWTWSITLIAFHNCIHLLSLSLFLTLFYFHFFSGIGMLCSFGVAIQGLIQEKRIKNAFSDRKRRNWRW